MDAQRETWPALPIAVWQDTYATLHRWLQIAGKIRMALSPMVNHWWHVTLYVTSRGLTTSPIPYEKQLFELDFDFVDHVLRMRTSTGEARDLPLRARSVAAFYSEVMAALESMGIQVHVWTLPAEIPEPVAFDQDEGHASYDPEYARRCWEVLAQSHRVLSEFRSRFTGKVSPVHFFWGSFDMAVTRFSGREAPPHPGGVPGMADWVTREAYSHEVSSCGFWPGGYGLDAVFYAYAYPAPEGFRTAAVQPAEAYFHEGFGEFVLPYETIRAAADPDAVILTFLQSTYEAAADLGGWDRAALER